MGGVEIIIVDIEQVAIPADSRGRIRGQRSAGWANGWNNWRRETVQSRTGRFGGGQQYGWRIGEAGLRGPIYGDIEHAYRVVIHAQVIRRVSAALFRRALVASPGLGIFAMGSGGFTATADGSPAIAFEVFVTTLKTSQ